LKKNESREASNWERLTDLYKDHIDKMKNRELLEQQAEYAREGRNAARWAAAGAWTAAIGSWRK